MYRLLEVSSLNLRRGRGADPRMLEKSIQFICDVFGQRRRLGRDSSVMVKMAYSLGGEEKHVLLGDRAADVLADLLRFGPRVINEGHRWELCSSVVRASIIRMERQCRRCMKSGDTHLLLKYDDLRVAGKRESYVVMRVCARCAICYLEMMRDNTEIRSFPYEQVEAKENI